MTKSDKKSFWETKIDEAKSSDNWYIIFSKEILLRRIPYNFEVICKGSYTPTYYSTLQQALQKVLKHTIELSTSEIHSIEEVLDVLKNLETKVVDMCTDTQESREKFLENTDKYYCSKCRRNHLTDSNKGQEHYKYAKEGNDNAEDPEENKDKYYCSKCHRNHRLNQGKMGKDHYKYREEEN